MYKKTLVSLAVASSLGLTGCLDGAESGPGSSNADQDYRRFTDKTWPVFNGLTQQFPVPNDILFALETAGDGTFVDGSDPTNPVTTGLGFMDGNSVSSAFDVKVSGSLDPNQELDARSFIQISGGAVVPNPDQNVFLLPLEYPGKDPLVSATGEIPSFAEAVNYQIASGLFALGQTAAATALFTELATPTARAEIIDLDGGSDNVIRINPLTPLEPKTKYLVIVTNDVVDRSGENLIGSPAYQNYSDPDAQLASSALAPFRNAILNWETLATGYFGFMGQVFANENFAPLGYTAPSKDDIVFTMTFTTTGVDDVLQANAAPRTFFESSGRLSTRKAYIEKLIDGTLNLTGQSTGGDATEEAINSRLYDLLTGNTTPVFRLFNSDLASTLSAANTGSVSLSYNDVAGTGDDLNTTLAFALQSAASQAAIDIAESTIAGQASAAEGGFVSSLGAIDAPRNRTSSFFNTGLVAADVNAGLAQPALISEGEITLPYFLNIPADNSAASGTVISTGSWTTNQASLLRSPPSMTGLPPVVAPSEKVTYRFPFAKKEGEVTVPVVVTYPDPAVAGAKPAGGWPVIIFQHGITVDRSTTLPLANQLAATCAGGSPYDCFATVAIDQPLHGVTPTGSTMANPGGSTVPGLGMIRDQDGNVAAGASSAATERHFNFTANASLQPTPMSGIPDGFESSGSLFINLTNFANSRDNLRQGVVDLLNVNASLGSMDIDGDSANGPDLNTSRVYFIGHSLGGVNGLPFVSVNNAVAGTGVNAALPPIQAAAILNSGGGITKLLANSPDTNFGAPVILPGLAAASDELAPGTSGLETYFSVLQGLLDSTDPVNFASSLAGSNVLLTEIVGDGTEANPSDQTIPNAADAELYSQGPLQLTLGNGFQINNDPAPLAGTEPVVAEIGAGLSAAGTLPAVTRFTQGTHGTPVSGDDPAVFTEMVLQLAELFSNGTISVTNTTIVE